MMRMPDLMCDEHLYSGFIRGRFLSGQMHLSVKRFFDLNNIKYHLLRSQVPLCSNLRSVVEAMASEKTEQFALRLAHTPFAPWLLSSEDGMLPEDLTAAGNRNNLEENPYSVDRRWKFCPECAIGERKRLGFSFWHASHQLLGARICPTHQVALHSHDELRYLNFTLPYHWLGKSEALSCTAWQLEWQAFIYAVSSAIEADIEWATRVKIAIREELNITDGVKQSDKVTFDKLFEIMKSDLGQDCLVGLFTAFAPHRKIRTNILWVTLSGHSQAKGLRHPLYWLVIIFWLRDKLPECSELL
ncbi:Transposon Tn7 transposition protein D [Psychromonas ingrahamii 37]|uniref:Transposon Tn7 transposition protein D n=2 Tax=Psychromonas ingrahamii TaxID=357794 RepID=A1SZ88_PSYIN|nr:Transposon Tn7 transposition protein D [Psychromonas ingrahamii 37]